MAAVSAAVRDESTNVITLQDNHDLALVDSRGLAALVIATSPAPAVPEPSTDPSSATDHDTRPTPLLTPAHPGTPSAIAPPSGSVSPALQLAGDRHHAESPRSLIGFLPEASPTDTATQGTDVLGASSQSFDMPCPAQPLAAMTEAEAAAMLEARKDLVHYLQLSAEVESTVRWVDPNALGTVLMVERLLAGLWEEETCVTARQLLQVVMQCDAFHGCVVLSFTDRPGRWSTTSVGRLMERLLADPRATVCFQAWLVLRAILFTSPGDQQAPVAPRIAEFLARHAHDVLNVMVRCLRDRNYLARRMMLKTVLDIVSVPRPWWPIARYVLNSPAVLASVMMCTEDTSPHMTFDAYHTLKVFIAFPKKCASVRLLIASNRVALALWAARNSSRDDGSGEQSVQLKNLAAVQPLSITEATALQRIGQLDDPAPKVR